MLTLTLISTLIIITVHGANGDNNVDCSLVKCAQPTCADGQELYTPSGECCQQCRDVAVFCAQDVKTCPDGSFVGRDSSNGCAFFPCPPMVCTADAFECPDGSFVSRDPNNGCQFEPCDDCSTVRCAAPNCGPNEEEYTQQGACCAECRPKTIDCSLVLCAPPNCGSNEELYTPEDACCPTCKPKPDDCSTVQCIAVACNPGQQEYTPEGECCPQCKLDCSAVSCIKPTCADDEELYTPQNECCPICRPIDCNLVDCQVPNCESPEIEFTAPGKCCPGCKLDCRLVRCALPTCEDNEELYTPENECCQQCTPKTLDCSTVLCMKPNCKPNEEAYTAPGECCPTCTPIDTPDCTLVKCALPTCADTEELYTPQNECCQQCVPTTCGGFIGTVCPDGYECIDDPNDDCDVKNGGADCGGICTDDICKFPAEGGLCKAYFPRYFYNSLSGQCEQFIYGGCGGNKNNFETIEECQKTCAGPIVCTKDAKVCCDGTVVSRDADNNCEFAECPDCSGQQCGGILEDKNPCPEGYECIDDQSCDTEMDGVKCIGTCELIDVCRVEMQVGPCRAAIPRYYYNSETGNCQEFSWGGCEPNGNNFETNEECEKTCVDICTLKPDVGPCDAAFERYFYNSESGECELFTYGGCEGNANNFESQDDCREECAEAECVIPESPFKYENMEKRICKFCFKNPNGITICKEIAEVINGEIDVDTFEWKTNNWILNEIRNEPECFLEYCKGENSEIRDDCEIEDVRIETRSEFSEKDCACDLIYCVEPTLNNGGGKLKVLIGLMVVLVSISWM